MAKKSRNSNVRKRIYTNSKGNDVFKSQKHMGSPYHSQDKKTGQIKSQSKKATEERFKPTTTKKRGGLNKTSKTSVGKAKSLPAKKGTAVGKAKSPVSTYVKGGKKVKDMGQATVVGKKALGAAKNALGGAVALGAPVVSNSIERSSKLINTGKLSGAAPMRMSDPSKAKQTQNKLFKSNYNLKEKNKTIATKANNKLASKLTADSLPKSDNKIDTRYAEQNKKKPSTAMKRGAPKRKAPPAKKAVAPKRKATDNFKPGKRIGNVGDATKRIESYRSAVNKAVVPKKTKTKLPSSAQYIQDWEG
jgi:hypothetical protein